MCTAPVGVLFFCARLFGRAQNSKETGRHCFDDPDDEATSLRHPRRVQRFSPLASAESQSDFWPAAKDSQRTLRLPHSRPSPGDFDILAYPLKGITIRDTLYILLCQFWQTQHTGASRFATPFKQK